MTDFEKLGVFYLGKEYDLAARKLLDAPLLYDSKDLVTHGVVVGMTGSGKTGLCIGLIEEAAIDGVPSILIDPKGDLTNLLLTFPNLAPADFLPWVNTDDARQKGLSPEDYARQQAELWSKGLASWGMSGERIQRLRDAAEFAIYTPGSSAGRKVSIVSSFAAPPPAIIEDGEMLRERVSTTATSLLALVGIDADPIQSREHILLSTIIANAWVQGQDLSLETLISQVQTPPVSKIGVLDLESFYPSKDRFGLVMALNNLLASPGFSAWMEGEPLEIGNLLYTRQGKPRVAIFSIAHLSDTERMFFVSLLLNQVLGWMRAQSGTTSLRALVYMDEIFGYLPPTQNPPSKLPMLTLLKQARAFGVGVLLATQNPVDLDYKALANAGTWFVGRMQTERDKARLLDGLEGAAAASGSSFDRGEIEKVISSLGNRVFLMNDAHEDRPVIFQTRWAMSYLRGPLTRDQIRQLEGGRDERQPVSGSQPGITPATTTPFESAPTQGPAQRRVSSVPALAPEISRFFIPARGRGATLVYYPRILGAAEVAFRDAKLNVDESQDAVLITAVTDSAIPVDWETAEEANLSLRDLEKSGEDGAVYAELPPAAGKAASYAAWTKTFQTWLYGCQKLELYRSPSLKQVSRPGESERDFRVRISQLAREQRDGAVEALRKKYTAKIASLQERLRKAQQAVDREKEQAKDAKMQTAISFGATLLGALTGRKSVKTSLGRATTAARGVSRSMQQGQDVGRAEDTVEALQKQLADLQAQFDAEAQELQNRIDPQSEDLETLTLKPKKADIAIQLVCLVWAPYWQDDAGGLTPAW